MRMLLAASALVFAAAPGSAGQRHRDPPAATPIGAPIDCLRLNDIKSSKIRDDSTIDFVTRGGKVYRNHLDHSCSGLGFEQRYLHKTSSADICSFDTITVLYAPDLMPGATCGLGKFQPVTLASR